ncbi:hypothetical protein CEXT_541601 [Caerostris extrusa]|uniref:Uncharacterized protein n=1 Tax=Caerostris extrusa TaxID=172846 RepID=A0AAV4UNB9_CAEEX|nr:hypothetical protein CEXT_541601 [Caerostris extrusa]
MRKFVDTVCGTGYHSQIIPSVREQKELFKQSKNASISERRKALPTVVPVLEWLHRLTSKLTKDAQISLFKPRFTLNNKITDY